MLYKVSVKRRIYYDGISREEEEKTVVHHYETSDEWTAIDMFKHDIFADAKLRGYELYMNDTLLHEIVFKAVIKMYGSNRQWTQYYSFDEFKAETEEENEQTQSN